MKLLVQACLDLLFPPVCHLCRTHLPPGDPIHLCDACREGFTPIVSPLCSCCGTPFATEGGIDHRCGTCLTEPPPFEAARAAFRFDGPLRDLIHRFKYDHRVQHRQPLGLLTGRQLDDFVAGVAPDLVVPVPLHVRRLRERGFNQAVLLGAFLARRWRLPMDRHNLRRLRWTEPQVSLSAAERAANVREAFSVHRPERIAGRRLLLVDDVYTTGSTVAECARTLKKAGAAAIIVITAARACS